LSFSVKGVGNRRGGSVGNGGGGGSSSRGGGGDNRGGGGGDNRGGGGGNRGGGGCILCAMFLQQEHNFKQYKEAQQKGNSRIISNK